MKTPYIIFCWVLHEQSILDAILKKLDTKNCEVKSVSLVCDEAALQSRLKKDIERKLRSEAILERSIARLPLYHKLGTLKIDTTGKSISQICRELISL